MRLRSLDLTRYGKFTNRVIDLGPARPGKPDLHILYGPNEAGKSTTLSAWLDLLYGIPEKTRYDFLHAKATMRVGAVLEDGARTVPLSRIRARTGGLLDATDAPLPEAAIASLLSGMDRAAYQAMFSLDDETLELGGESILQSQGDLGQLLFSTSAGLTGLSAELETLRREADTFFRPNARSGGLVDLRHALEKIEAQRREIDTQASQYARLTAQLAEAEAAWSRALSAQTTAEAVAADLARCKTALPLWQRLQRVAHDLAQMPDLPPPPPGWANDLDRLVGATADSAARQDEVRRATVRLAELVPDDATLALADRIAAAEELKSAHDEAVKDLPARMDALTDARHAIASLLHRLGQAGVDPAQVALPPATLETLRALTAARSGIEARLATSAAELSDADLHLSEARARLADAGTDAGAEALAPLLARLRAADPGQALRLAQRAQVAASGPVQARLAAVSPWAGSVQALAALPVPGPAQLQRWQADLDTATRRHAQVQDHLAHLTAEGARQQAVRAMRQAQAHASPADAAHSRAQREHLWALHRASLTNQTAQAFEIALRQDDRITAQLAAAGADAQLDAQAQAALAQVMADLDAARMAVQTAQTDLAAALAAPQSALHALGLPADTPLPDLRDWLARRDAALEAGRILHAAEADVLAAESEVEQARQTLSLILGQDAPYDILLATAQARVDAGGKHAALRTAYAEAERLKTRRQHQRDQAQDDAQVWHRDWAAACAGSWLAALPPDAGPMQDRLALLADLRPAMAEADAPHSRITKMQANRDAFRAACADLGQAMGLTGDDLWPVLTRRLRQAEDTAKTSADVTRTLERLRQDIDALADLQARLTARLGAAVGGATDVPALRAALTAAAARAELAAQRHGLADDLTAALGTGDLGAAEARMASLAPDTLDRDLAQAAALAGRAATEGQQAFATLCEARRQLAAVGGDDAVARLDEQRQTLLIETAEAARKHLRQRFGILALDHGLRTYRDSHRSAMMLRASDAFRTISRGAYTGLAAQPDKDREVLVALSANGASKRAQDLSKGTRFQLYLALRVAGYHVLAAARPPVPFIADDIMETFDDDRAAEAFCLLSDMAAVGQVIYLTHHRHLCDIATRICPDAVVHEL
ncbi:MAG: AAA family ATPase [Pseudomonadota bacterium]